MSNYLFQTLYYLKKYQWIFFHNKCIKFLELVRENIVLSSEMMMSTMCTNTYGSVNSLHRLKNWLPGSLCGRNDGSHQIEHGDITGKTSVFTEELQFWVISIILLGALHHGSSAHAFSRAHLMSMSLDSLHDLWEVWLLLMRSEPQCVAHAEDKRKETGKGHSANESWRKRFWWKQSRTKWLVFIVTWCEECGRKKRRKRWRNKQRGHSAVKMGE